MVPASAGMSTSDAPDEPGIVAVGAKPLRMHTDARCPTLHASALTFLDRRSDSDEEGVTLGTLPVGPRPDHEPLIRSEIGPPIICTHKGISSIVGSTPELADPRDIGPAAARNPDIAFVVYHSGFEPGGGGTGPYDPDDPDPQGVDRLIRSLQDAGVEPNSNVYAELGGTWWFLMRDPTAAAHRSAVI